MWTSFNRNTQIAAAIALVAQTLAAHPAHAETDRKIASGMVCQPESPADRDKLSYHARGIEALADVTVTCAITRDSTLSGLKSFEVRYQRGLKNPVPFEDRQLLSVTITGSLFSCDSASQAANPCGTGIPKTTNGSNFATSILFDNPSLDGGEHQYYVYKTTLPKGILLRALEWTEKVQ